MRIWTLVGWMLLAWSVVAQDTVDDLVKADLDKQRLPGVSICIVKEGKTVLSQGYGFADLERDVAVKPGTVFRICSLTKQFTAAAILLLKEDGKLNLDDTLDKFLPEFPRGADIKLRHLLTHTSGIVNFTDLKEWRDTVREDRKPEEMLKLFKDKPLRFEPGEQWEYSNSGYLLLGLVIEKASGEKYGEFLSKRIFEPLGMKDTRLEVPRDLVKGRALGYSRRYKRWVNADPISMTQAFAAGQILSTAEDLAKWNEALHAGKVVKKESFEEMTTPVKVKSGKDTNYGFGLVVAKSEFGPLICHTGGINGFSTFLGRFTDKGVTVAVLVNCDAYDPAALAVKLAKPFLGK